MSKVSLKGVLIGGIVDVVSSSLLGIPFAIYALSKVDVAHTPKDQLSSAIVAVSRGIPWLYGAQLLVGISCSIFAGYVAAWLAKHDEELNGTLSSYLCVALGIYSIAAGKDSHAHWVQLLILITSPVCGFLGGYLRARSKNIPVVVR
jgi:hypothetical protein